QNAIFKYAAGATGNLELGPSSGIGITFNGATGNAGYAGIITAAKFVGDGSDLTNLPGGGSYGNNDVDNHLNVSGASSGQILSWNGSDYAWVADQTGGGVSGISTISGVVNIANDLDVDGHTNLDNVSIAGVTTFSDTVKVGTGVTALTNGNVSIGGTFEIFESSGIANRNFSQFKLSNFSISQFQNTGSYFIKNSSTGQLLIGGGSGGNGGIGLYNNNLGAKYLRTHSEGSVEIFHDNTVRIETSGIGATVYGQLDTTD
ncbi:MAG: hypothetical protein VXY93_14610, partial [Pseudomonadota bacterium]|nr:hypothetical protein [Pseudomonadota bacterium]